METQEKLDGRIPPIRVQRSRMGRHHNDVWVGWEAYGIVEPEDRSWILYLNKEGRPWIYWAHRDELGGVTGAGITLDEEPDPPADELL